MATFPALNPSTRTYVPAVQPSTSINTLNGSEMSVRNGNSSNMYILRLSFKLLTRSNHTELLSHYATHGRFQPFDLDSVTLTASGLTFPTNYRWVYASSPETEESCGQISATVELELIPSYTI
jgi:hypothetical protein